MTIEGYLGSRDHGMTLKEIQEENGLSEATVWMGYQCYLKDMALDRAIVGAVAARRILIALNYAMAQDGANPADIKVFVTNNGGDASPTWEDATNKFISQDYYEFTNTNKTSPNFAVAFRVVINSNDSMGEIWIDGAGMTFD